MSNKSKDTRNVILVVTGILFFCMMNGKEGFSFSDDDSQVDHGTFGGQAITTVTSPGGATFTIVDAGATPIISATELTPGERISADIVSDCRMSPPGGGGDVVGTAKWAPEPAEFFIGGYNGKLATDIDKLMTCEEVAGATATCADKNGNDTGPVEDTDCGEGFIARRNPSPETPCTEVPCDMTVAANKDRCCIQAACTGVNSHENCIPQQCTDPSAATCTGTATDPDSTPDCADAFSAASDILEGSCPAGCTYTIQSYASTEPYDGCLCPAGTEKGTDEQDGKCVDCPADTYRFLNGPECVPCPSEQTPAAGKDTCISVCSAAEERCADPSFLLVDGIVAQALGSGCRDWRYCQA